jgi:hypothetical protein
MRFQRIVLVIAGLTLILIFIFIGISFSKGTNDGTWPPLSSPCPDYWTNIGQDGASCLNTHKLGTCNIPSPTDKNAKNFDVAPYNDSGGTCAKYTWAKSCGITWDGITSGIPNPC